MVRTVLPNVLGPIVIQLVVTASMAVVVEAGLTFLGLGTPPPAPSWGGMLQDARSYLYQSPSYGLFPGLCLVATVFCLVAFFVTPRTEPVARVLGLGVLLKLLGIGVSATIGQVFLTLAFGRGAPSALVGFASGDKRQTL